jgi:MFS family permease
MYVVSFLDRANISFAKQALQTSVGISAGSYAFGAGLFFLSYALLEVPSNVFLYRVGARIWMSRIMVSWGLVSMATMFVRGPNSFYVLRLLLGAAEAGFFPGVILYLTYWFPSSVRGQIFGLFYLGAPLAFIFGSPISGLLLQMSPRSGLQNWQWMFLTEGLLAVVIGIWAYRYLDDAPSSAAWLPVDEQCALAAALSLEEKERRSYRPLAFFAVFCDLRIIHFVLIYFLIQMSVYGVIFYLPTEVAAILHTSASMEVGFVSAIPWICALTVVSWLPQVADRGNRHRQLAALTLLVSGCAGFVFPTSGPVTAMVALSVAVSGFIVVQPMFWTFPSGYLAGSAAAGAIAVVNAMGALGGFLAPNAKVWADAHFGSNRAGLYLLATLTMLNAGLIAGIRSPTASKARSELT